VAQNDRLDNGKTKSGAIRSSGKKRIKNTLLVFNTNPGPVIANADPHIPGLPFSINLQVYPTVLLQRIQCDIQQGTRQSGGVSVDSDIRIEFNSIFKNRFVLLTEQLQIPNQLH